MGCNNISGKNIYNSNNNNNVYYDIILLHSYYECAMIDRKYFIDKKEE